MNERNTFAALLSLAAVVVLSLALIGMLALNDKVAPDVVEQAISMSLVGIVGVLGAQRREATPENPMPVAVQEQPVETVDASAGKSKKKGGRGA